MADEKIINIYDFDSYRIGIYNFTNKETRERRFKRGMHLISCFAISTCTTFWVIDTVSWCGQRWRVAEQRKFETKEMAMAEWETTAPIGYLDKTGNTLKSISAEVQKGLEVVVCKRKLGHPVTLCRDNDGAFHIFTYMRRMNQWHAEETLGHASADAAAYYWDLIFGTGSWEAVQRILQLKREDQGEQS